MTRALISLTTLSLAILLFEAGSPAQTADDASAEISDRSPPASPEVEAPAGEPEEDALPEIPEYSYTATPEEADAAWPDLWAEGGAVRRSLLSEIEGQRAPALDSVEWVNGQSFDPGESGDGPLVMVFFAAWNPEALETVREVAQEINARTRLTVRFLMIHPDEGRDDLDRAISTNRQLRTTSLAIDQGRAAAAAYHVDSYPDFHLVGSDGTLLCADVANDHIVEVLDAAIQRWAPSSP